MFKALTKLLFGDKQSRDMKTIIPVVDEINAIAKEYESLSDDALRSKSNDFRKLLKVAPRIVRSGEGKNIIILDQAEHFLTRHPDVAAAVFVGSRRDFHPAPLNVFVKVKDSAKPSADLAEQIRSGMGRASDEHRPKRVIFVDEFPLEAEGKRIDYHRMTRAVEEGDLPDWAATTWKDIQSKFPPHEDEAVSLDDILPEAFAAAKETCRRHVGKKWMAAGIEVEWNMVPFDVQLAGGIAIHRGNISEMGTGEGKTLTAIFPMYLNALAGKGAHLVTVNDYLARRDSEWMAPIFGFLGLTTGCLDKTQPGTAERRLMYQMDITYGTNNEFGFDYLRDNMVLDKASLVQREPFVAIVDEVDSVLVDEARTPLIIAGPVDRSNQQYEQLVPMIRDLVNKQQLLVSRLVKEATDLLQKDPASFEAGVKMLQCHKGMPKHNRYMKLREEPRNQKLQDRVERELMLEKKIPEIEAELFFVVEEKNRQIDLSEKGRQALSPDNPDYFILPDLVDELAKAEQRPDIPREELDKLRLQIRENYEKKAEQLHSISQLLHAFTLKNRDVEYVVEDGKVVIVDENTGRKMAGRRWSDGLHGAVEAKEGLKIEKETQTLATITIQNYFRMYKKLSGMTGTAETESAEFQHTYKMDVVVVPPNKPTGRKDMDDVIYKTKREKYKAVLDEIERLHGMKLPILVGTTSVAVSETVSRMLRAKRLPHEVLNAKNHQMEAEIVAKAGQEGAITIATNMAGRGTDIKLGPGARDPRQDETGKEWPGGLQIIGTERHESRRIDRQLRGRSGRQGDPGTSRFFLSLEDDLMMWFGSDRIAGWMEKLGLQEGEAITYPMVTRAIGNAQKKIEGINQERRKRTLEYDDVMNKQRTTIYRLRRELLTEEELGDIMLDVFADALDGEFRANYGDPENHVSWNTEGFFDWVARVLFMADLKDLRHQKFDTFDDLVRQTMEYVVDAYNEKRAGIGPEMINSVARYISLRTIDAEWQDHLLAIDSLREGIGLRGYGQKDPLIEFTKDATDMFAEMLLTVHKEIFDRFFRAQVVTEEERQAERARQLALQRAAAASAARQAALEKAREQGLVGHDDAPIQAGATSNAPAEQRPDKGLPTYRRDMPKVGRNDPCPCGSGKKYKECHGSPTYHESRTHSVGEEPPPEE